MYNLIDNKNFDESNTPWPTNLLKLDFEDLNYDNLKSQWKLWFNDTLEEKSKNINTDKICMPIEEIYNVSNFSELKYTELRDLCKKSYPYFIEWWNMLILIKYVCLLKKSIM